MLRRELLMFFFSLLAFSLAFALLNAIGFDVAPLRDLTIREISAVILGLSATAAVMASLIGKKRNS